MTEVHGEWNRLVALCLWLVSVCIFLVFQLWNCLKACNIQSVLHIIWPDLNMSVWSPLPGSRCRPTVSDGGSSSPSPARWAPTQGQVYWTPVCAACLSERCSMRLLMMKLNLLEKLGWQCKNKAGVGYIQFSGWNMSCITAVSKHSVVKKTHSSMWNLPPLTLDLSQFVLCTSQHNSTKM